MHIISFLLCFFLVGIYTECIMEIKHENTSNFSKVSVENGLVWPTAP